MTVPFSVTRMIPAGWSARHAAVLPTSFNAAVTIGTRQGDATYDPGTDDTSAAYSVDHAGGARIQHLTGTHPAELSGQHVTGMTYLVEVAASCPAIPRGARVLVTAAPNDPSLVGRELWVIASARGSEMFTRSVFCSTAEADSL